MSGSIIRACEGKLIILKLTSHTITMRIRQLSQRYDDNMEPYKYISYVNGEYYYNVLLVYDDLVEKDVSILNVSFLNREQR